MSKPINDDRPREEDIPPVYVPRKWVDIIVFHHKKTSAVGMSILALFSTNFDMFWRVEGIFVTITCVSS
jgi:hypothetical protein